MGKHFSLRGSTPHDFNGTSHGGELSKGKRRIRRPLKEGEPLHLVLKSNRAFGRKSLLHPANRKALQRYTRRFVFRFRIRLYSFANVGNHIHIVIRVNDRKAYTSFITALTGTISKMIFKTAGMWDLRPFTRVAEFGRELAIVKKYVIKNIDQSLLVCEHLMKRYPAWRKSGFDNVVWSWDV